MSTINSTSSASYVFATMARFVEAQAENASDIADEINHSIDLGKKMNEGIRMLRDGDVDGFVRFLSDPANKELADRFGPVKGPDQKVIDRAEVATPEIDLGFMKIEKQVLVEERSHMEYSPEAIDALKDRMKDLKDEDSQLANQQQIRLQLAVQGQTQAFNAASNTIKSDHDRNMTAVNNSKA